MAINVLINGDNTEFEAPISIDRLLSVLALDQRKIAIERNRAIVPRSLFGATLIEDGDQVEIVNFVGGG